MQCCSRSLRLGVQYARPMDLETLLRRAFATSDSPDTVPKRRGKPPKQRANLDLLGAEVEPSREHGRPPKQKANIDLLGADVAPGRRGRPLKTESNIVSHNSLQPLHWSADEDRIILDHAKKGSKTSEIAKSLKDRSIVGIRQRQTQLLGQYEGVPYPAPPSSGTSWTPEEDATITGLQAAGLRYKDMLEHLPGRTFESIKRRWQWYLSPEAVQPLPDTEKNDITDEEIQRMIDLRLNHNMGLRQTAAHLNRPVADIQVAWRTKCRRLLPEASLRALRGFGRWTREQDEELLRLHKAGLTHAQIASRIASKKNKKAIGARLEMLQHRLERARRPAPSMRQSLEMRRALLPILEGEKTLTQVCAMFPGVKRRALQERLARMRQGFYKTEITAGGGEKADG